MIDTHTHLYMEDFSEDADDAVRRAIDAGVSMMIFPAVSEESNGAMVALSNRFPENTRYCLGLHPTELKEDWEEELDRLESQLGDPGIAAIGETGIDLYWDQSNEENQKKAFHRQIQWASERKLPLIIHCRNGVEATLDVLKSFDGELPRMIFHSFTSGIEDVKRIREVCDPYFGINGVATFKNAKELREAIPEIGIDRIVLETDSPYLSPVPFRGTRNESKNIPLICHCVASVLGLSPEETERITDENARQIFSI